MKELNNQELSAVSGGCPMCAVWVFYTVGGPLFALGAAHGVSSRLP